MSVKKGIVVESKPGWAILLLPGGEYKKIKTNRHIEVGQQFLLRENSSLRYGAIAAIFILVLFGVIDFFSVKAYARLESGLELGVNRWDRVVSVNPRNEKSSRAIEGLRLAGKPIETAVGMVMDKSLANSNTADGQKDEVAVEVIAKDKDQPQIEERLLNRIDREMTRRMNKESFVEKKAQFQITRDNKRILLKLKNNNPNQENTQIDASKLKGPVKPVNPVAPNMSWPNQTPQEGLADSSAPNQTVLPRPDKFDTHEEIKNRLEQRWQERREAIQDHREQVLQQWQQQNAESKNIQQKAAPVDNRNRNKQTEQENKNADLIDNAAGNKAP
ncbi:anti-sigma-I factor RsgI family protein [Syntrophomonas palmitatica]|uniref:anti-sigma-I factor RsgI family protein n=1 Tax=Syntrophomonas palmitatica TaxID=402877 RepID=UPI0006D247F1|nr:anti-sigma factor domain-containing protein [Syntrophomonas palmitatica]